MIPPSNKINKTKKEAHPKCQNSTANTAAATPSQSSRSRRIFARGTRSERTKENARYTSEARKASTTANTADNVTIALIV